MHNAACFGVKFQGDRTYCGWGVTVLFYRALHEVSAFLVEASKRGEFAGPVPDSHNARKELLRTRYPTLWARYRRLFDVSYQARYTAASIPPGRVQAALQEVAAVETEIQALTP